MRIYSSIIILLLMPPLVSADIPCVWGEAAPAICDCERFKNEMQSATDGDPDAQYKIWQLKTFSEGLRFRSYMPAEEEQQLSHELQQCKESITWKERIKLKEQGSEFLRLAAGKGHINAQFNLGMQIWDDENRLEKRYLSKNQLIKCKRSKQNDDDEKPCAYSYWAKEGNKRENLDELRIWANSKRFDDEYNPRIEELIRNAAESGHVQAQFALARILILGIGVSIDEIQGQAWRIVAVAQNPPFGANIRDGNFSTYWLTDEEKMEAQAIAEQYMIKYTDLWDKPSTTIMQ